MSAWIFILAGMVFLAALYVQKGRRSAAIRSLATRLGFHYLRRELPKSLTLHGTPLSCMSSISNVIDGEIGGVRVVAFDCRIGSGKGSWRRTVIAVESEPEIFGGAFNLDLSVDRAGRWAFLYEPKAISIVPRGLMPIAELESHLNAIRNPGDGSYPRPSEL